MSAAPAGLDKSPQRIAGMFDAIAAALRPAQHRPVGGARSLLAAAGHPVARVHRPRGPLDVCTGTGDVALAAARARRGPARVVGVDFAGAMLDRALAKARDEGVSRRVQLVRGDAMRLPLPPATVDGATIAFGIRNVAAPDAACAELHRVLRPGGRVAILEFGLPVVAAVRPLYLWYFRHVLPRIGRAVSRHDAAYSYLPASVGAFPSGEAFANILRGAGFNNVRSQAADVRHRLSLYGRAERVSARTRGPAGGCHPPRRERDRPGTVRFASRPLATPHTLY